MKKLLMICLITLISKLASGQESDAILGKWQNPTGDARIEIYKAANKYSGKIYWLRVPNLDGEPKRDKKNPDPAKQFRPIINLEILNGFVYSGNKVWAEGNIYDPKSGKIYDCKMTLKNANRLDIRGYVGISLLGRSETWTRVK